LYVDRLGVQKNHEKKIRSTKNRTVRVITKVGPKLNLRANALVARLCRHGQRGRARRMLEETLRIVGELVGYDVAPTKILNSVLSLLEPPFEIKTYRRRWGVVNYPAPVWPQRKYFLAVKILICGARCQQKLVKQPFVTALAQELVLTFKKKSGGFSRAIYRKLVRVGLKNRFQWRRLIRNL